MSDRRGCVLLIAPYPEPLPSSAGGTSLSPPGSGSGPIPLWQQSWPIRLDVLYDPVPSAEVPDLCAVLRQQAAIAWADKVQTMPLAEILLRYGQPLQVRTEGEASGVLLVTPAASPP